MTWALGWLIFTLIAIVFTLFGLIMSDKVISYDLNRRIDALLEHHEWVVFDLDKRLTKLEERSRVS